MKKYYSAAMRGRYDSNGKTRQHLETRWDEIANAITTINTDSMVIEKGEVNVSKRSIDRREET